MSKAIQDAYAEYLRIAELFRNGDPNAESAWQEFVHADNGLGLAMEVINGRVV